MTNRAGCFDHRSLETLFSTGSVGGLTEGQLLERFLAERDPGSDAAFDALVALHGPMVWKVCRNVLSDRHAAEDAFQATFLVLVRKAASIRRRDTVGPWLYGSARKGPIDDHDRPVDGAGACDLRSGRP